MYDSAYDIFDYLPIHPSDQQIYIDHLWGAFETIVNQDEPIRPFAILPFHLLSMFALQYKVFRLSAYKPKEYLENLNNCNIRDPNQLDVLKKNMPIQDPKTRSLPSHCRVVNLSMIPEGRLFTFLSIIGIDNNTIQSGQNLVEIRNSYSHANGYIELDMEGKIDEYIDLFKNIQPRMLEINDRVAENWLLEMENGEAGKQFMELNIASEYLCTADMQQGKLSTELEKRLNGVI